MRPREDGMIQAEVRVDSTFVDFDEFIKDLHQAAEGLVEVRVDVDSEWDSPYLKVVGWRLPNLNEIASMGAAKAASQQHARQELRRLRRDYPELFDKQGRAVVQPAEEPTGIPF